MDTRNTDRIYNWFGSALSHDELLNQKFYYDFSDSTFFNLTKNDNQYSIEDKTRLNDEDITLLLSKIDKIKNNDPSLLEIKKSKKELRHLFDQTTSHENYMKREQEWNFVNDEIKIFLDKHTVDISKSRLIE